jgi:hypothetical protein
MFFNENSHHFTSWKSRRDLARKSVLGVWLEMTADHLTISIFQDELKFCGAYPLVNIQKTMETHHFNG